MAVGDGNNLEQIMYSWFSTHISMPTQAPIEDRMRAYFASIVQTQSAVETLRELEIRWLHSLAGVGAATKEYGDLWREAVVGAGQVPQNDISQNKWIYFSTVS